MKSKTLRLARECEIAQTRLTMDRLRIGVIGTGTISGIYMKNLTGLFSDRVEILGCADLDASRAELTREKHQLPRSYRVPGDLIADSDIEAVLNLTVPAAHYDVSRAAVDNGKHVYVEKPLCTDLPQAVSLIGAAVDRGVRVASAPDTFLGAGQQACRRLIDDGVIGEPVAAVGFVMSPGPERWHPDPGFLYRPGGGPMFDMGPYYLTALVNLMGPISAVSGSAHTGFPSRTIGSGPRKGTRIAVDVPTHVVGLLDFESGASGTIITSFDVWAHHLPCVEVYGTEGSLSVPDPNTFGGAVLVRRSDDEEWNPVELTHGYSENSRGLGLADLADAVRNSRPHRASADLARHVLEAMHGIHVAARSGSPYNMTTRVTRPEPMPEGF